MCVWFCDESCKKKKKCSLLSCYFLAACSSPLECSSLHPEGTIKYMHVLMNTWRRGALFLTELILSCPPLSCLSVSDPLSDTLAEWTWHCHLTGIKWAMSNDKGYPAHWLIVLNNEPCSPFWLVLEVGWQLAEPFTVYSTVSLKWICRIPAGVAGVKPPFSIHPLQHTLYARNKPS